MAATFAAALVIGVISACVGSIYYCHQPHGSHDCQREEEESEEESPFVRIKISHPHRERIVEDGTCTDLEEYGTSRGTTDSNVNARCDGKTCTFGEHVEVVPVKPPRNRRSGKMSLGTCSGHQNDRSSKGIWSSAMQNRLDNITNSDSSTTYHNAIRTVRTQVEVYPHTSDDTPNETNRLAPVSKANSSATSNESRIPENKRHHSVVKKWKHLKKSIMCSRLIKSISIKEVRTNEVTEDEMRRSNITVRASLRQSPMGHSTMLRKNLVNASTSTKLSARTDSRREIRPIDPGSQSHGVSREVIDPKDNSRNTEILEDVVSLIKRRSVDGKSLCDVRITGLSMNQAELLGLFEATGGKSKSASIVTTEEASIISIKFQRDQSGNNQSKNESMNQDSPLRSIFKFIPDKLTIAKWFRSDEKSREKFTRVPKHLFVSGNETSYLGMPRERPENSLDSSFPRGRFAEGSLTRFVEERKR